MDSGSDPNQRQTYPRKCAWCGKVQLGNRWVAERRRLVENYSHGICEPCSQQVFGGGGDPQD